MIYVCMIQHQQICLQRTIYNTKQLNKIALNNFNSFPYYYLYIHKTV